MRRIPVGLMSRLVGLSLTCLPLLAANCGRHTPETPGGRVALSLSHVVGMRPLELGTLTPYANAAGSQYGVARLQYFISDVELRRKEGDPVALLDSHYVDARDAATLRVVPDLKVPQGDYTGVSLRIGFRSSENTSGRFVRPPESLMAWPDTLGGGYHYLKAEGRYVDSAGQDSNFNLHMGPTNGVDRSVAIVLDHSWTQDAGDMELQLVMDVDQWLRTPVSYNFNDYPNGTMESPAAQQALHDNGLDVFTLAYAGPITVAPPVVAPPPYTLVYPDGVPVPMVVPLDNPSTAAGVELGRRLFYDPQLDGVGSRACGQCHQQAGSFTMAAPVTPTGILPHINLAFASTFLWDGKVSGTLEDAMRFEVEQFFKTDVGKLQADAAYGPLFERAFGAGPITTVNAAKALAQFERTLLSFGSKYDGFLKGTATLSDSEERGRQMFFSETADCFHCHGTLMFTDNLFHNNALDTTFARQGLCDVTHDPADCGKFKTPTLRNIALTAPYMHDDRFPNLETVVEFYSEQIVPSPTVDPLMKYLVRGGLHLTYQQKVDLLAFLRTLTDESFTADPAHGSPFP